VKEDILPRLFQDLKNGSVDDSFTSLTGWHQNTGLHQKTRTSKTQGPAKDL